MKDESKDIRCSGMFVVRPAALTPGTEAAAASSVIDRFHPALMVRIAHRREVSVVSRADRQA